MITRYVYARRFIMVLLFGAALGATFEAFSGMDIKTTAHIIWAKADDEQSKNEADDQFLPLEEAFDWSRYPAKTVVATGYTAGMESTGKNPEHPAYGITYSGVKVKRDLYSTVAADPNVFPIGTILFIPGYGYGVVADTGSAIKGNKIDLYFETVEDVYSNWGKKTVDVHVIKMGSGTITEDELTALNEDEAMQVFRQSYLNNPE